MKQGIAILLLLFSVLSWSQEEGNQTADKYESALISRKNCFYGEILGKGIVGSVNYERILPFSKNNGLTIGLSAGFLLDFVGEVGYVLGKGNHFAEFGVGYSVPEQLLVPRIGYRYQGKSGFLFKIGPMYFISTKPESFGDFFWGGASFGYCF